MAPSGLAISQLELRSLSDEQLRELYDVGQVFHDESRPEDPRWSFERFAASIRNLPAIFKVVAFEARDGGKWIGEAQFSIQTDTDENKHAAWAHVAVLPAYRRQGVARELLNNVALTAGRLERTLLIGYTSERVPAGAEFCRRIGAESVNDGHENRLELTDVDQALIDAWIKAATSAAAAYELRFIDGPSPEGDLEQVAAAFNIMNDAPRGGLQIADDTTTPDQVREFERSIEARGSRQWALYAVEKATGRFVGVTDVTWEPDSPEIVHQGATAVHPDHRGHGLGKWLKAEMIRRIQTGVPGARRISTGNADSNGPMLANNQKLGFKPHVASATWQVATDQLHAYLAERSRGATARS